MPESPLKLVSSHRGKEQIEAATAAAMYVEDRADTLLETVFLRDGYADKIEEVAQARLERSRDQLEWVAWGKVLQYLERMGRLEDEIADIASELGEEGRLIQIRLRELRQGK